MDGSRQLVAQTGQPTAGSLARVADDQPDVIRRVTDIEALARELNMAQLVARARHLRWVLEHLNESGGS